METASLELCKELWELSKWNDFEYYWGLKDKQLEMNVLTRSDDSSPIQGYVPAYSLGFLLRKLPSNIDDHFPSLEKGKLKLWALYYMNSHNYSEYTHHAKSDNPEDVVAMVLIQLFKLGVLNK